MTFKLTKNLGFSVRKMLDARDRTYLVFVIWYPIGGTSLGYKYPSFRWFA